MQKALLAGVAVTAMMAAGFAGSAAAASLPAPVYKAPVYKAPALAPLHSNWTGFYLGGHVGYGWGTKDFDPFAGKGFYYPTTNDSVDGILGGVQGGYNYQMGWLVLGIEGEFSGADIKGDTNGSGPGCTACFNFSSKTDWLATVTGRIGGTFDNALFYFKGGVAWAHDKYAWGAGGDVATAEETKTGWVVGGGVEYAFTRNWSAKIEYDYMDLGTDNLNFCAPGGYCTGNVPGWLPSVRQRINVVKVGFNYRFDWLR